MKNLQQTEKHLADKLQNVPVPDVDQGWEQMRKLLDQEMPEPVAGAWSGNRKWWWMGITAGVIMLATWLTQQLNSDAVLAEKQDGKNVGVVSNGNAADNADATNNNAEKNNGAIKTNEANNNNNDDVAIVTDDAKNVNDKTSYDVSAKGNSVPANSNNSSKDNSQNSLATNSPDKTSNDKTVDAGSTNSIDKNNRDANLNSAAGKRTVTYKPDARTSPTDLVSKKQNQANNLRSQRNAVSAADETKVSSGDKPASDVAKKNITGNKNLSKNDVARNQSVIKNPSHSDQNTVDASATNETSDNGISKPRNAEAIEPSILNIAINTETEIAGPAAQFHEINGFQPGQVAVSGKTDRAFAREMRKKSMKADNRRISRSSMRGNSGDNEKELTFAAGLALPQSFAVGSQHSSAYNVNGGSGRIMDYLPAPFFQYHINNKLFVQTEFHFQSPQYTQRFLLSRSIDSFASRVYENNVRLEKLYYFNIPFNVYYSPARNFYIGGGVQYSSLLSGVASYENRATEGQTVLNHASVARRFNYDSVASVFSPSEWRYQFDANYYFNRFTLGLRFNQAMTDFIDMRGAGYVPPARDRNKSFLLYLRFNIWEERKKEAN
jgi:hypothetical protein